MSLTSPNPDNRVFYYSEIPNSNEYKQPECFYFKVLEFNDDNNFLKYVIISRINEVSNSDSKTMNIIFNAPFIPESIVNATKAITVLQRK